MCGVSNLVSEMHRFAVAALPSCFLQQHFYLLTHLLNLELSKSNRGYPLSQMSSALNSILTFKLEDLFYPDLLKKARSVIGRCDF